MCEQSNGPRAKIAPMVSGKPTGGLPSEGNAREDEARRMFEREYAGVKPLRRGGDRISSADFGYGRARKPGARRTAEAPPGRGLQVEVRQDGTVGWAFGVSRRTLSSLGRGEPRPEAVCDLHKLHVEAARRRLRGFVEECVRKQARVALVICGRGLHSGPEGPVLAKLVAETLASPPLADHVLAFSPAPPEQGGQGAMAVLFRRAAKP